MNEPQIRQATARDVNELVELEKLSFVSDKITKRQFKYLINQGKARILLAELDGKTIGYAILLTPTTSKRSRLYSIAVKSSYRGRGIGRAIIGKVIGIAAALEYEELSLEVRKSDLNTIKIYEEEGFRILKELPGYYEDGTDGIRMVRGITKRDLGDLKSRHSLLGRLFFGIKAGRGAA
ncbi:MAG: N-acetyltransferase [Deltaproteobacteria bacterium]|nr:MAG: N-acetyltransferase [Deltaproteobacteria bacterium]